MAGTPALCMIMLLHLTCCANAQQKPSNTPTSPQPVDTVPKTAAKTTVKASDKAVVEDIPYGPDKGEKVRVKDYTTKFSPLLSTFYSATPSDLKRYYPEPLDLILTDEGTDPAILQYYAQEFKPKYRNYIWIKVKHQTKMIEGHPVDQLSYEHQLILPEKTNH